MSAPTSAVVVIRRKQEVPAAHHTTNSPALRRPGLRQAEAIEYADERPGVDVRDPFTGS
ncbi:hypothetical protein [Streptomyces noursei]|uniref:hypothetical protein n=1 Tax=Streptomyces noursei TaxID=1971 RepID=UPI001675A997|nr:hypothetical protein [Streptomyces noursei]